MEEGFVECTLFYCFYEKMAYVTETLKSHLADFTSVSQLVSQNEKVHTRWGWLKATSLGRVTFAAVPNAFFTIAGDPLPFLTFAAM